MKNALQEQAVAAAPQTITLPILADGEAYAGLILNEDGTPAHHVILLAGDGGNLTFKQAQKFAADAGGELPTRREQSLLFANCKPHFKADWYWSGELDGSEYAWCQYFGYGFQDSNDLNGKLRARAVRRLPI